MRTTASPDNVIPLFQKNGEQEDPGESVERPFPVRLLQNQDYTLILGRSCVSHHVPQLPEQWQAAQSTIQTLGETCANLDRDGVKLYVASVSGADNRPEPQTEACQLLTYDQVSRETLTQLLKQSCPPTSLDYVSVLEIALQDYFQRKASGQSQPNGELFLVILDGEPSDRQGLINLIVQTTQRMDNPQELAIGLVQIGEDAIAQGFFQALDDDLHIAGATYDIVHTQNITTIDTENPLDFLWDVLTD